MKTLIFTLLLIVVVVISTSSFISAQFFSEPAKAGMYCDHDKLREHFRSNYFTSTQTIDSGNTEKPFTIQHHLINVSCSASGSESDDCGKCNSTPGSRMKTFVKLNESAPCLDEDILTLEKEEYITGLLDDAVNIMKDLVIAPDFVGGLTPSPSSGTRCGDFSGSGGLILPDVHILPQLGVHFMLYVTAGPPSPSLAAKRNRSSTAKDYGEPLAWAGTCGYTQASEDRPIVGHIHFAPRAIPSSASSPISDSKRQKDLYFVLHQIMHMLGWSLPLYPNGVAGTSGYLDPTSSKSTYSAVNVPYRSWAFESRKFLSSTQVRTETRTFFGCSTASGAEYGEVQEDFYLSKRIFADDFMSEPLPWDPVPRMSRVSMALLQDTGFWKVNFALISSNYNTSKFGFERGCTFINQDCRYPASSDWEEFCWSKTEEQCSVDLSYGGPCDILDHPTTSSSSSTNCLPTSSKYYFEEDECRLGGPEMNDYCPTAARVNSYSQCNDLSNTRDPNGAFRLGNAYSSSSRCIQGTVTRVGYKARTPYVETRCVELVCATNADVSPSVRTIFLRLFNNSITVACPVDGGEIDISYYSANYSGFYVCPPFSESFCTDKAITDEGANVLTQSPQIINATLISGEDFCQDRLQCAMDAYNAFVPTTSACTSLSKDIQNCFLAQCPSDKSNFLKTKLSANCSSVGNSFKNLAEVDCSDGVEGAMDLCNVVTTSGAGKLEMTVAVSFSIVIILMLFAILL